MRRNRRRAGKTCHGTRPWGDGLRRLPAAARKVLAQLRQAALARRVRLAVVGGAARDLLAGQAPRDLDVVVEGETRAIAAEVAAAVAGLTLNHTPRFGTSSLLGVAGIRVDLAAARQEIYPAPASAPLLSPTTLEEDLRRRDYSLNAIGLEVSGRGGIRLLDPCGGRRDVHHRRLRLLHENSLADDPSRAFRGMRLAGRLRLRIEPRTRAWMRCAVDDGSISRLTEARVQIELSRLGDEPKLAPALRLIGDHRLLAALHPALGPDQRRMAAAVRLDRWRRAEGETVAERRHRFVILLALLGIDAAPDVHVAALLRCCHSDLAEKAVDLRGHAEVLLERLANPRSAAASGELLSWSRRAPSGALVLAAALATGDVAERVRAFRRQLSFGLRITPADLIHAGVHTGPEVGWRLEQTLRRRIGGELATREEELAFALGIEIGEPSP